MRLLWSPRPPFVRKVMIVLRELDLLDRVELVRALANPRGLPNPAILADNPLGKIPVLLMDGLPPIFDSAVICDGLADLRSGGEALVPRNGPARLRQMRWQALGDGLTDNLLLWRAARLEASGGDPDAMLSYRAKVRACLRVLEEEAAELAAEPFGIGQIAILCALGQLDFRFAESAWRAHHPVLAAFAASQAERPSVAATLPDDDRSGDAGPAMTLSFEKD